MVYLHARASIDAVLINDSLHLSQRVEATICSNVALDLWVD